jgi:hypothetical protein
MQCNAAALSAHVCRALHNPQLSLTLDDPFKNVLSLWWPIILEPVLLLKVMSLFYRLWNCLASYWTTGRNFWKA